MIYNYNVPKDLVEKLGFCEGIDLKPDTLSDGHFAAGATNRLFYYGDNPSVFQAIVMANTPCARNPDNCFDVQVYFEQIGDQTVCLIIVPEDEALYFLKQINDFVGLVIARKDESFAKSAENLDGYTGEFYDSARKAFSIEFNRTTREYTLSPSPEGRICTSPPVELPTDTIDD